MKLKSLLLLAPVCWLGACAIEPRRAEPPETRVILQPAPPSEADQLLLYILQTRKLDAREHVAERDQVRNAFQAEKTEYNRVKLAVLLASTPASLPSPTPATISASTSDDTELIALLEPLARDTATSTTEAGTKEKKDESRMEVRALATLLYGMAQERKKLRDQWREAQTRLNALRKDDTKDAEARALRARVEELERNLVALKSIDRSVNRRTETPRIEPPRVIPPK